MPKNNESMFTEDNNNSEKNSSENVSNKNKSMFDENGAENNYTETNNKRKKNQNKKTKSMFDENDNVETKQTNNNMFSEKQDNEDGFKNKITSMFTKDEPENNSQNQVDSKQTPKKTSKQKQNSPKANQTQQSQQQTQQSESFNPNNIQEALKYHNQKYAQSLINQGIDKIEDKETKKEFKRLAKVYQKAREAKIAQSNGKTVKEGRLRAWLKTQNDVKNISKSLDNLIDNAKNDKQRALFQELNFLLTNEIKSLKSKREKSSFFDLNKKVDMGKITDNLKKNLNDEALIGGLKKAYNKQSKLKKKIGLGTDELFKAGTDMNTLNKYLITPEEYIKDLYIDAESSKGVLIFRLADLVIILILMVMSLLFLNSFWFL